MSPVSLSSHGSWLERTHNTIVSSFSRDELRQAVQFALGVPLDSIAADKPLDVQVFDLLLWTTRTGRTLELIRCLLDSRPLNRELAAVAAALENGSAGSAGMRRGGTACERDPPAAAPAARSPAVCAVQPRRRATAASSRAAARAAAQAAAHPELYRPHGRTRAAAGGAAAGTDGDAVWAGWDRQDGAGGRGDLDAGAGRRPPRTFPRRYLFSYVLSAAAGRAGADRDRTRLWRGPAADRRAMPHARRWRASRR